MKCQGQDVPWVLINAAIVFSHVVKQGVFVTEMIIGLHLCVDAPFVRDVSFLSALVINCVLRFFYVF